VNSYSLLSFNTNRLQICSSSFVLGVYSFIRFLGVHPTDMAAIERESFVTRLVAQPPQSPPSTG
jgi:hypothetical protein